MLDSIRSSAQSFGVKIAFGLIILVFVFWGIGNFNDRDYSNVVAMVNGEPIVAQEFERAYQNAEEYILRNNPGMTREQLARQHLGRQVLRELIQATAIQQEAAKAGIQVTPLELRQAVGSMPVFQNEQKQFDPEVYKRYLAARRISAAQYEKELGDQIVMDKVFGLVTAPAWVAPDEAKNRYNFLRENRIVDYIFVPAKRFESDVKVEKNEIEDWYNQHKSEFAIPAKADISYIVVKPEALVDPKSISKDEVLAKYDADKKNYETPERIKVSHILVPLTEDADEAAQKAASETLKKIQDTLNQGKSFADAANEYNQQGAAGPGGELGWISRGQTVEPFEEAAFALDLGKVSEPVRSPFGWHLILVEEKKPASVKSLEDVEQEIRLGLAAELGADKMHDALDNLIEDNILQKPLEQSAEKYGLKAERTGLADKTQLMEKLGIKDDSAAALLAAAPGAPLDTALEAGNNYVIARIEEQVPAGVKPLSEVENEIVESIKNEKALLEAEKAAQALLNEVKPLNYDKAVAEKFQIQTSNPIAREGQIADFSINPVLNEAIFEAKKGNWLERPFNVTADNGNGAIIVRVDKIVEPDTEEFEKVKDLLTNAARQERIDAVYGLILQRLVNGAKIEITNQNLIDRNQM